MDPYSPIVLSFTIFIPFLFMLLVDFLLVFLFVCLCIFSIVLLPLNVPVTIVIL
ncbi:hypothetical protein RND71_030526 [Anisodus tanguticus]|uniref:Uncharacterized protein n=1 Tax=Anisodus tanguticus TaxID=243964 RepID=A0AAE1RHQ5_9SOLA|nr:hypothetical protein RND71_030526 [Anisodus tanguticus]